MGHPDYLTQPQIEELITAHILAHINTTHRSEEEEVKAMTAYPGMRICNEAFVPSSPPKPKFPGKAYRCGLVFPHMDEEHKAGWKVPR